MMKMLVFFGIILIFTVSRIAECSSANMSTPETVNNFFPQVGGNLTKIVWAHAVNSKSLLNSSLSNEHVMMIEADIVLGNITGSNETQIPIMAHPPNTTSDLSLKEFLTQVHANGKKGVKLDFKSIEAYQASEKIIEEHYRNMSAPMWLNADILAGPVNATSKPVTWKDFIDIGKKFPNTTLSLGWTTRYEPQENVTSGNYTTEQFNKMKEAVNGTEKQSVTFAIRAVFAASNNVSDWQSLLNSTANSTLSIWSHDGDAVDADKLSKLITTIGVNRVYIDVPADLMAKLRLGPAAPGAQPSVHASSLILLTIAISFLLVKVF